jgi:4-hydroxy-tetrahydrodipicolinate synthase
MQPLAGKDIRGNWGTVLLPINPDDTIDWPRLRDEIDALITFAPDGIYTNGTAGEFWSLSEHEFDRITALVAERCEEAGIAFQIGACHPSPQVTVERVQRARQVYPGAIQVVLPDWWPTALDEAVVFLNRLAQAAHPVGLVLYNPPHAKSVLIPEEIGRLKRAVPPLVGIKVAAADASWYAVMREHAADLSIFVAGHRLAEGMALGAHGSYSNVACLHPGGAQRWYELMKVDLPGAREVGCRIQRFMNEQILPFREKQGFSNMALDKLLAAIGGWAHNGTRVRWPYRSIPKADAERLRPIARNLLPELFEP